MIFYIDARLSASGYLSLKVSMVKIDFDLSVRYCQLKTCISKSNLTLGTHLHSMIRAHHFDLDIRF